MDVSQPSDDMNFRYARKTVYRLKHIITGSTGHSRMTVKRDCPEPRFRQACEGEGYRLQCREEAVERITERHSQRQQLSESPTTPTPIPTTFPP
jgi:hypothetical protein